MHIALVWLLVPLGAFLWRVRGGLIQDLTGVANWHGFNDTAVRALFAVDMALAWLAFTHEPWRALFLSAALFVTCVIGWFGAAMGLTDQTFVDAEEITASGFLGMLLPAVVVASPWPLFVGALCSPIYWIGSKIPQPFKGCVWEEILYGAAIGAALAGSVLCPHL